MGQAAMKQRTAIFRPDVQDTMDAWKLCQKFFNVDFKYQAFKPQEIEAALKNGEVALYIASYDGVISGACIVSIEETRTGGRSLFIPILGGVGLTEWGYDLADFLENVARANGCETIEYIGRKGFSRLDSSYVEDGRIYVKEIK